MEALDANDLRSLFFVEAREHLEVLSSGLLGLQTGDVAEGEMDRLFRAAHSVKGGAGACDLPHVVRLTHTLEGLLDDLRQGSISASEDLTAVLLTATDQVLALIDRVDGGEDTAPEWLGEAITTLKTAREAGAQAGGSAQGGPRHDWTITVVPEPDILQLCNDPMPVLELLAQEGVIKARCAIDDVPPVSELDPLEMRLRWTIELREGPSREELDDILCIIEDEAAITVEPLAPLPKPTKEASSTATAARPAKGGGAKGGGAKGGGTIRVDTGRIDSLLDEVGELVMAHAVVAERAGPAASADPVLTEALKSLQRRMRTLQDGVLSMRMRPIRDLFERVPRLVFELGRDLGKKARVEMQGEWTEVDREVLEKLADPLVHLVRNALDHGMETPDQRLATGKAETCTLLLSASHEGGDVLITLSDDGRGIDPGRILAKAREKGVVPSNALLDDTDAINLIFQPGFSTAEAVTDVSGRGVGMDVVRQNIEALGGRVGVRSVLGEGTVFRIALPLTLAILDGQLLTAGGRHYVVPVRAMVECLRPDARRYHQLQGRGQVYMLRGEALPVLDLANAFGTAAASESPLLVVVESAGHRVALQVDSLGVQRQFVLKSLDRHYRGVPGLAGASVLTDGTLAMVLDAATLSTCDSAALADRAANRGDPAHTDPEALEDRRLVTFECSGQVFAVAGRRVVELRQWERATPLPFAGPTLLGAIAFSGEVVPVHDGRRVFGLPDEQTAARSVVMVLDVQGEERSRRLGLRVDRVLDVRPWSPEAMSPAEDGGVVHGLIPEGDGAISVIDIASVGRMA